MLFTSLHFVVFFIVVLALNHPLRRWPVAQKLMLLAASYYFYGQREWHAHPLTRPRHRTRRGMRSAPRHGNDRDAK